MMNKKNKFLIGILITLCTLQKSIAADIFVSNSNELANACLNAISGDVINILAGIYTGPFVLSDKNNVTLKSYNGQVYLEGSPSTSTNGILILQILNSSTINVQNLVFRNNWGNFADGINIGGEGDNINISNCEFYNIGWSQSKTLLPDAAQNAHAIVVVGSSATSIKNIFIGGNFIHDCITGYSESLTLAGNVEFFLVEGNTLTRNTNIGIDVAGHFPWTGAPENVNFSRSGIIRENIVSNYEGPPELDAAGGIYIDGGSFITVENNSVFNYKVGYSVGCEVPGNTSTANILRNNLAYNCSLSGLFLGSNTTSQVTNTQVLNNTFYKCGFGTFDNGQLAFQNNTGTIVKNNIFYPTNFRVALVQMGGTTSTNNILSHNLYWRDNSNTTNLFYNVIGDVNSVKENPLFVNTEIADFHISELSPAINTGDPDLDDSIGQEDLDGTSRIQGERIDIGVDEFENLSARNNLNTSLKKSEAIESLSTNELSVYPNPVFQILNVNGLNTNETVGVFDLYGRLLIKSEQGQEKIDLSNLEAGVYFLKFSEKDTSIRFIKK